MQMTCSAPKMHENRNHPSVEFRRDEFAQEDVDSADWTGLDPEADRVR